MSGQLPPTPLPLATKIARLVEERGWNKEDFARIANLNRQTVRQIFEDGNRKLRNTTVSACARALGLPVMDLRTLPLERLLPRMNGRPGPTDDEAFRHLFEGTSQPELHAWIERNPDRARQLTRPEIDELLNLQGPGGPMATLGVERVVELIERKRRLFQQVQAIAGTEYLDLLEKLVALMYEKVQPFGARGP
jgi:hypothetical protein